MEDVEKNLQSGTHSAQEDVEAEPDRRGQRSLGLVKSFQDTDQTQENNRMKLTELDEKLSNVDLEANSDSSHRATPPPIQEHIPDPNLVVFKENDPDNPRNWSKAKRWLITANMGAISFVVTFASTVFSTATQVTAEEYHVSNVVTTLGTSLFVLGFAGGPIIFGPCSELYGRKIPIFAGCFVFAVFQIPVAVAQNLETILVCRFIGGFAAVAPVAVIGGALADMWDPLDRAIAVCVFAAGVFVGPIAGPIGGGFITQSYLGWRWTAWMTLILEAFFGTIGFFLIPETSGAKILQKRAYRLRHETKNWALHAKADEQRVDAKAILWVYLLRPFVMLVQEPILLLLTLYMSLVYGIVYLSFESYPVAFIEVRGWSLGVGALPFVALIIGVLLGAAMIMYSTLTHFKRSYLANNLQPVPEQRLPPMIVGGIMLPVGLFWFAWTSSPSISWVPQTLSGIFLAVGFYTTFWQGTNYIIDCYGFYANSALAANTFIRSIFAAAFPLFAEGMYHKLGVDWASSLLAFICVAFVPVPVLFYVYGPRIRRKSKWAPT
ncbi:MAG: hypothetical protein M1828_004135 [Chrysothrix sp. TS-e1954]|nr:MAG: hypothetical protein M1828_004135 [Chrysothrix sp. TS-e1954]